MKLQVTAQDRPGIIRDVSRLLSERGINIESLESQVASAAMSAEHMFSARLELLVPAGMTLAEIRTRLETLGSELMVDLATT